MKEVTVVALKRHEEEAELLRMEASTTVHPRCTVCGWRGDIRLSACDRGDEPGVYVCTCLMCCKLIIFKK